MFQTTFARTTCRTRVSLVLLMLITITVWMPSGVTANVKVKPGLPALELKDARVQNGESAEQVSVSTSTSLKTPNNDEGVIEMVPRKRKKSGDRRRTESVPKITTEGNSWKLIPLVAPEPRAEASKPASAEEDDDEDDGEHDEEDEDEDDLTDMDDDEDDDEDAKELEIDADADDILTDRNYDEKLQASKETSKNVDAQKDPRPNIILILTDDQDIELGSMEYMPETLKAFRAQGIEFRHGYVTTPMCCPSRSSILTGLYVHNHQVYTNNDNCSSIHWRENFEKKTFASYLWDSGYYTSYIGKYLNKYDGSHIPYGWDEWNTLLMNSRFYNYTVNRNGAKIRYGSNYNQDYYPNSIANDTINFLQRMAASSSPSFVKSAAKTSPETDTPSSFNNKRKLQQPFMLVASFPSPHGPEDSAPEYKDMFLNTTAHHTPSYNHAPNLDKQWILRVTSKMNPTLKNFTNMLMTKRLQTLQSVDLAVSKIMNLLRESGLADNTYVFYTSDHGYHVGQFGLVKGKSMPYEFDIRVPFFVSPPKNKETKVPPGGTMIYEPVLNIDLAPTFLDLGNLAVPGDMDGRSMVPLLRKYSETSRKDSSSSAMEDDYIDDDHSNDLDWTHSFLIESSGRRDPVKNPEEMSATTVRNVMNQFEMYDSRRSSNSRHQSGAESYLIENETSATELALCQLHPYPCQIGQRKYCRREKNRIRFRKCRYDEDFVPISPSYDFGLNISSDNVGYYRNGQKCSCSRTKRSAANMNSTDEHDWEEERRKIDDEIELLKLRIEELRERRRNIRRKFSKEPVPNSTDASRQYNAFRHQPGPVQASSFLPISVGQPKRPKKVKNNHIPVPTSTSASNVTFLNAFNLYPKLDFTTFLNIDDPAIPATRTNSRKQDGSSTVPPFHGSDELFEEYDDEDGIFEDDDDANWQIDPTDYSLTTINSRTRTTTTKKPRKSSRNENGEQAQGNRNRDKKPKSSRRNEEQVKDENEEDEVQRVGRKKTKEHRNTVVIDPVDTLVQNGDNECDCSNPRNTQRWLRQQEREDRKRKKLLSKLRKKQRFLHRIDDASERQQAETCGTEDKMNCFWHDRSHWRTEPKWTLESFCFCMNSNNNTYSCIRTVNSTHNYLYCHFITGFKMYYDLNQDPFQLRNMITTLPAHQEDWMLASLLKLKKCQGHQDCFIGNKSIIRDEGTTGVSDSSKFPDRDLDTNRTSKVLEPSIWERIFGSRKKKHKKNRNGNDRNRQSRKLKQM